MFFYVGIFEINKIIIMGKKNKKGNVVELSSREKKEINAGTERSDQKRANLWEIFFEYLRI